MTEGNNALAPSCRYGHGNLVEHSSPPFVDQDGKQHPAAWAMPAFGRVESIDAVYMRPMPVSFTVKMFVCHTCGYMEFFDADVEATRNG